MRTCTVPGCNERHHARDLCSIHYSRMRTLGALNPRPCLTCGAPMLVGERDDWHRSCEPTLCVCRAPKPNGLGECAGCKRLVLALSWHEGRPVIEQERAA